MVFLISGEDVRFWVRELGGLRAMGVLADFVFVCDAVPVFCELFVV